MEDCAAPSRSHPGTRASPAPQGTQSSSDLPTSNPSPAPPVNYPAQAPPNDFNETCARSHFELKWALCECAPKRPIEDLYDLSVGFASMDEKKTWNAVRYILLALSLSPLQQNDLLALDPRRRMNRKQRLQAENTTPFNRTLCDMRGQWLCRHALQLSPIWTSRPLANARRLWYHCVQSYRTGRTHQYVIRIFYLLNSWSSKHVYCDSGMRMVCNVPLAEGLRLKLR